MLDTFLNGIGRLYHAIPFTGATWFVIAILSFFVWLFAKSNRNPNSPIKWEHLIIDSENDRASPYKVGYLIGLLIGTWIVVTLMDKDKLTYDMFGMYLTYLLGGAGWNTFMKNKAEANNANNADFQYGQQVDSRRSVRVQTQETIQTNQTTKQLDDVHVGADGKLR